MLTLNMRTCPNISCFILNTETKMKITVVLVCSRGPADVFIELILIHSFSEAALDLLLLCNQTEH